LAAALALPAAFPLEVDAGVFLPAGDFEAGLLEAAAAEDLDAAGVVLDLDRAAGTRGSASLSLSLDEAASD